MSAAHRSSSIAGRARSSLSRNRRPCPSRMSLAESGLHHLDGCPRAAQRRRLEMPAARELRVITEVAPQSRHSHTPTMSQPHRLDRLFRKASGVRGDGEAAVHRLLLALDVIQVQPEKVEYGNPHGVTRKWGIVVAVTGVPHGR